MIKGIFLKSGNSFIKKKGLKSPSGKTRNNY